MYAGLKVTEIFERGSVGDKVSIPEDFFVDAVERLRIVSLVFAIGYLFDWGANALIRTADQTEHLIFSDFAAVCSIGLALSVFVLSRTSKLSAEMICNIGLVFEVLGSLGIALDEQWTPYTEDSAVRGISVVAFWVAIFPVMVPNTILKTVVAAVASASMVPLALALSILVRGNPVPSGPMMLDIFLVPYIAAAISPISARIIWGLGQAVQQARRLGSYRLVERLGEGGMGEVWHAEHKMLVRPAAIKLIRPETLSGGRAGVAQQFEREAQATAALRSPHTVELYDFGITNTGVLYYVMELLHGLSLQTLVEQFGTVPPNRTAFILAQVCRSLEEAHYNGLIHRDVKPANILVCHHSVEYDFVKVLDFGLVRSVHLRETDSGDGRHVAGTPAYMAPEVSTNPDGIDHRVDIYALGCVAYWMLTGSLVFDAKSTMRVIRKHVLDAPAAPSEMSDLNISPSMDALVLQCLHKDPDHRPQNVREVRKLLLEASSDNGEPPWTQERAEGWWTTHRPRLDHQRHSPASTAGADPLTPKRT